MKNLLKIVLIPFVCILLFSDAPEKSVWREATTIFGSDAYRYLYLALPFRVEKERTIFPLETDGGAYYVKKALYSISVNDGVTRRSFDVNLPYRKVS